MLNSSKNTLSIYTTFQHKALNLQKTRILGDEMSPRFGSEKCLILFEWTHIKTIKTEKVIDGGTA